MAAASGRFYRDIAVCRSPGGAGQAGGATGYSILLDDKPVRTPAGSVLSVPSAALAEAIAREWQAQAEKIRPETMMLTKLANTAIDRVAPDRYAAIEQVLAFAKSDLICYRAPGPEALAERQAKAWDPLLDWARERLSAPLVCTAGLGLVPQAAHALAAMRNAISARDDFALAALHAAATLTGSAVIALALAEERLSAEEAFAIAELDEIFQAEKWGKDEEALRRSRKKALELAEIASFFKFVSDRGKAL